MPADKLDDDDIKNAYNISGSASNSVDKDSGNNYNPYQPASNDYLNNTHNNDTGGSESKENTINDNNTGHNSDDKIIDNTTNNADNQNNKDNHKGLFGRNKKKNNENEDILILNRESKPINTKKILIIAVVILLIIAVIISIKFIKPKAIVHPAPPPVNIYMVSSCENITSPGNYTMAGNISYAKDNGTCISIESDNVNLDCNKNTIHGNGPYAIVSNVSYGIAVENRSNVSIKDCKITYFSYGISFSNTSNSTISDNNISYSTLSNIKVKGGSKNTLFNNSLVGGGIKPSSIYLYGNTSYNKILNDRVIGGDKIGFYINGSGNAFYSNYVNNTPYAFYCSPAAGLNISNSGHSNICIMNNGCNFVSCNTNIPDNQTKIVLSKNIYSCGSINKPGNYSIETNLSAGYFNYISNISASELFYPRCIKVNSPNVNINCNNHYIYNTTMGVDLSGYNNVSFENCNFKNVPTAFNISYSNDSSLSNIKVINSTYGFNLVNFNNGTISNVSVEGSKFGIELFSSIYNYLYNLTLTNNTFGLYLNSSNLNTVDKANSSYNKYGIFINSAIYNSFSNSTINNNKKVDIYAEPYSVANASTNLVYSTKCGLSDTVWANCKYYVSPDLQFYPIDNCTSIIRSGEYEIKKNLVSTVGTCISINASNVTLEGDGFSTSSISPYHGIGVSVNNETNVTINNMNIIDFKYGIKVANGKSITINGSKLDDYNDINMSNLTSSYLTHDSIESSGQYEVYTNGLSKSVLYKNSLKGNGNGTGLYLYGSGLNLIFNNSIYSNKIGLKLINNSTKNTIFNNTVQISSDYDFYCGSNESYVYSEYKGYNYGQKLNDCHWLSALNPASPDTSCYVISAPSSIKLSEDALYKYGTVCIRVKSPDVTFNCNNHTISALNGGTFINVRDSPNFKLENCYLQGFTSPIQVYNSSGSLINNSILTKSVYKNQSLEISNSPNMILNNDKVYTYVPIVLNS